MQVEEEVNNEAVEALAKAIFQSNLEKSDKSPDELRAERKDAWRSEKKNCVRRAKQVLRVLATQDFKIVRQLNQDATE